MDNQINRLIKSTKNASSLDNDSADEEIYFNSKKRILQRLLLRFTHQMKAQKEFYRRY